MTDPRLNTPATIGQLRAAVIVVFCMSTAMMFFMEQKGHMTVFGFFMLLIAASSWKDMRPANMEDIK